MLESKGPTRLHRKITMVAGWYAVSASIFLNIFIVGYVILFANCDGTEQTAEDCKSGLGSKIGAVLILMVGQSAI